MSGLDRTEGIMSSLAQCGSTGVGEVRPQCIVHKGEPAVHLTITTGNDLLIIPAVGHERTPAAAWIGIRSIQAEGIEPDIKVKPLKVTVGDNNADSDFTKEADLSGHLRNDRADKAESAPADSAATPKTDGDLAQSDYQLSEALNLLKGMILLQARKSG